MRAPACGATIAALSFSLGGAVLFQVCNVIFYVSAAWLPWSLGCWWMIFVHRQVSRYVPATAACLAMMCLGGDPQMAYHSMILGFAVILLTRSIPRRGESAERWFRSPWQFRLRQLGHLGLVGCMALGMAAVQLLPSASFARISDRARGTSAPPRSVWEAAALWTELSSETAGTSKAALARRPARDFMRLVNQGLLAKPPSQTHAADIYLFEQPLWTTAQLIWPNCTGKWMPIFQRWTLRYEKPEIWNASVFMGVLPLVLGLSRMRLRQPRGRWRGRAIELHGDLSTVLRKTPPFRKRMDCWMTWILLFFLWGAAGSCGLVGILNSVSKVFIGRELIAAIGDQVAGVYWGAVTFLPFYVNFRYPAKLFIVVALMISLLAARNAHPLFLATRRLRRTAISLLTLTIGAMTFWVLPLGSLASVFDFRGQLETITSHPVWGPFDATGCFWDVLAGLVFSASILVVVLSLSVICRWRLASKTVISVILVCVSAIELFISNRWLTLNVDADYVRARVAESVDDNDLDGQRWVRFHWNDYVPAVWATVNSRQRLGEFLAWQRQTLGQRFNLDRDVALVGTASTVELSWSKICYASGEFDRSEDWLTWFSENQHTLAGSSVRGAIIPPDPQHRKFADGLDLIDRTWDGTGYFFNPDFAGGDFASLISVKGETTATKIGERKIKNENNIEMFPVTWTSNSSFRIRLTINATSREGNLHLPLSWVPGWTVAATPVSPDLVGSHHRENSRTVLPVIPVSPWEVAIAMSQLPPGGYELNATFDPPGLLAGGAISIASWAGFFLSTLITVGEFCIRAFGWKRTGKV